MKPRIVKIKLPFDNKERKYILVGSTNKNNNLWNQKKSNQKVSH